MTEAETMTDKQIQQVREQLPNGEAFSRIYRAYEGDIRAISRDGAGEERRYRVHFDTEGNTTISRI